MNNRERIVIYGAMALLIALNITVLANGRGPEAWAEGPADREHLGPAGTLTLVDAQDDPLVLRNTDGRLAWAAGDHARVLSIAFVHVGKAMGPLLESREYRDEYGALEAELREHDEELAAAMFAFREEHKDVQPDGPDAAEVQQAFQAMRQRRDQLRLHSTRRLGALATEHIERAYRDLVAAVEVVAGQRGIDLVYRFIPTGNGFQALGPAQAYTSIRARIALKYPPGLDITDEVMEELALEVE